MSLFDKVVELRRVVLERTDKLAWLPPLVARFTVGLVFASSGWGKLHNLENVTSFFTDLGIPFPAEQALFVSTLELVGGVCLLIGLFSRLMSLPLIGTMAVAILTAKREELTGIVELAGLVEWAYIALFILIAIQ